MEMVKNTKMERKVKKNKLVIPCGNTKKMERNGKKNKNQNI